MRKIKFRGRDEHGVWHYGDLLSWPIIRSFNGWNYEYQEVEEDTVGQFTGLLGRNGKEIYEGDILHITAKNPYRSPFDHKSAVKWDNSGWECFGEKLYDLLMRYSVTVIGNVYDNSKLLEAHA